MWHRTPSREALFSTANCARNFFFEQQTWLGIRWASRTWARDRSSRNQIVGLSYQSRTINKNHSRASHNCNQLVTHYWLSSKRRERTLRTYTTVRSEISLAPKNASTRFQDCMWFLYARLMVALQSKMTGNDKKSKKSPSRKIKIIVHDSLIVLRGLLVQRAAWLFQSWRFPVQQLFFCNQRFLQTRSTLRKETHYFLHSNHNSSR